MSYTRCRRWAAAAALLGGSIAGCDAARSPRADRDATATRSSGSGEIAGDSVESENAGEYAPCRYRPRKVSPAAPLPQSVDDLWGEALGFAQQLTQDFPGDANAYEIRGRIEYAVGCIGEAESSWQRALAIDADHPYALHGLGLTAAKRDDYRTAADLQQKALAHSPDLGLAAQHAAEAHLRLGSAEQAIEVLQEYLKLQPDDISIRVQLGHAQLAARRYEEAKQTFEVILEERPDLPRARYGLTMALTRLGQHEAARDAEESYQQTRQREVSALVERRRGDDLAQEAEEAGRLYTSLSRFYLARQRLDRGTAICRRAARLAPRNIDSRKLFLAAAAQTGDLKAAGEIAAELVELEPDNLGHRINLGSIYEHTGRLAEARRVYEDVIKRFPGQAEGHAALARVHLQGRDPQNAVAQAQHAVKKERSASNLALLAQALAANGQFDEALASAQRAVELEPNTPEWRQLQQLLERERRQQ